MWTEATAASLEGAHAVVLVEGTSDQAALTALARIQGRSLASEGMAIVAMGGAHAITRHLLGLGPAGRGLRVGGLCDEAEVDFFVAGLAAAGVGAPRERDDLERFGFFVCSADLEDELIRACGRERIEEVLDIEGDLGSFRTFQKQPGWRDEPFDAQMRRFLGAGARRKRRYAELLVSSLAPDQVPRPLREVLDGP